MKQWAIVGAGPAGIAAIGKLLDSGVKAGDIVWIDPDFSVGDFGTKWRNVDSNTKAVFFTKFLLQCQAFQIDQQAFPLFALDPEKTCKLSLMADCLQTITKQLLESVPHKKAKVEQLDQVEKHWVLQLNGKSLEAKNVVLATGAKPKAPLDNTVPSIDLACALDIEKLKQQVTNDDVIAVFGSSHSAVMIVRDLLACGVKRVINFYRSPLRFALFMEDWILFDNTGLKGNTQQWARDNLQGALPEALERYLANDDTVRHYLPHCDKAIYAVGFDPKLIDVPSCGALEYNDTTGIIAPGLFGIGIAFPEGKYDPLGNFEHNVGLWKFMVYLDRILPIWLRYGK